MGMTIRMGHVEALDTQYGDGRIRVRLDEENGKGEIPEADYAFPLLPKHIQSIPKVGEGVFIITSKADDLHSNRYYIGPIVSQPHQMIYSPYMHGTGPAIASLKGGNMADLKQKISQIHETDGAFPVKDAVSLIGRQCEDISLRDGEVMIRCGARLPFHSENDPSHYGWIRYNDEDTTYIQLKYSSNAMDDTIRGGGVSLIENEVDGHSCNGVINLVSDKINLISHKERKNYPNGALTEANNILPPEKLDTVMKKLHRLPYGEELVEVLDAIIDAIIKHSHKYANEPTTLGVDCMQNLLRKEATLANLLSPHIRIS